jgi:hypothetical protein
VWILVTHAYALCTKYGSYVSITHTMARYWEITCGNVTPTDPELGSKLFTEINNNYGNNTVRSHAIAQEVSRVPVYFSPQRHGAEPGSGHVGLMVGHATLGQVLSQNIGLPCFHFIHCSVLIQYAKQWPTYGADCLTPPLGTTTTLWLLVCKRTIPTEWPPPVGEF